MVLSNSIYVNAEAQICVDKIWIESTKGKIACATPPTAAALVERGWGTMIEDSANMQILSSMKIHPEKTRTAAPLPETSMGPQIDYSKDAKTLEMDI